MTEPNILMSWNSNGNLYNALKKMQQIVSKKIQNPDIIHLQEINTNLDNLDEYYYHRHDRKTRSSVIALKNGSSFQLQFNNDVYNGYWCIWNGRTDIHFPSVNNLVTLVKNSYCSGENTEVFIKNPLELSKNIPHRHIYLRGVLNKIKNKGSGFYRCVLMVRCNGIIFVNIHNAHNDIAILFAVSLCEYLKYENYIIMGDMNITNISSLKSNFPLATRGSKHHLILPATQTHVSTDTLKGRVLDFMITSCEHIDYKTIVTPFNVISMRRDNSIKIDHSAVFYFKTMSREVKSILNSISTEKKRLIDDLSILNEVCEYCDDISANCLKKFASIVNENEVSLCCNCYRNTANSEGDIHIRKNCLYGCECNMLNMKIKREMMYNLDTLNVYRKIKSYFSDRDNI